MTIREEFLKAYGDGVIRELENRGVLLTDDEQQLVVLVSWDGVWYGIKVGVVWTVIAGGLLALVLR